MIFKGLPWWLSHKESACNAGAAGDIVPFPLGWEEPLEEHMASHSSILALKKIPPHGRGAGWVTVKGVAKSQTQLERLSTHMIFKGL